MNDFAGSLIRPSAAFRALCVGRIRSSVRFGFDRLRYLLSCGNAVEGGLLRVDVPVGRAWRAWAMGGTRGPSA